jgi:hypothetical protein
VRKSRAEVSAVYGAMPRGFGRVEVFTAPAVELDRLLVGDVGESDGKEGLERAEDARATTKVRSFVFFELVGWRIRMKAR